jgi:hypothetical protein
VLEHDGVAQGQVGAGEPGHLILREVPRHDAQDHPDRTAHDDGAALTGEQVDRLVGQELLGVVGVELVNGGTEVDLSECLVERLAHFADHDVGQLLAAFGVQFSHAAGQSGSLRDRGGRPPLPEGLRRRGDRRLHLSVGGGRVLAEHLAGGRISYRVHAQLSSSGRRHFGIPRPRPQRRTVPASGARARVFSGCH